MSDYISREALIGEVEKHYCAPCKETGGDLGGDWCRACVINGVLEKVRGIPAADVEPVVHGRKIEDGDIGVFYLCSLCDECLPYGANYCPNCGAKMDLEE